MANLQSMLEKEANFSAEQYKQASSNAQKDGISIMYAIEEMNVIKESLVLDIFSRFFKIPKVQLGKMDIPKSIIELIPKDIASKFRVIPIDRVGNNIIVAMGDPRNLKAIDAIRFKAGYFAKPVLASELKISEALKKYYSNMQMDLTKFGSPDTVIKKSSTASRRIIGSGISDKDDGPIIKLVNDIILQCVARGASDIHIEVYEEYMRIRLRIDGSLFEIARPPVNMKGPLISRIKIMSGLNIAETRLPQDGAINIQIGDKPVDFRVNTLPTSYGEKIVMRILDKSNLQVDMRQLGFEADQLKGFKTSINNPYGMVLVTGPTGSGKTTTLYSALQELNREEFNIMTAEDPVEYNLTGINQVQMKPDIGLNFAAALRAFLRQDPDIIMVGEIRDLETAEIAMKASLTGHMVLSTLHTNSASDTISRLLNMGVAAFNLVAALNCITAQRLMKKICTRCKIPDPEVTPQVLLDLGIHESYIDKIQVFKGRGCAACGQSGSKGRIAVHEVLLMNEAVKRSILKNEPAIDIKKVAMSTGMRTLRQSALTKMANGIVTAQEVIKATSADTDGNLS